MVKVLVLASMLCLCASQVAAQPTTQHDYANGLLTADAADSTQAIDNLPRGEIVDLGEGGYLYIGDREGVIGARPLLVVFPGYRGSGKRMLKVFTQLADQTGLVVLGLTPENKGFALSFEPTTDEQTDENQYESQHRMDVTFGIDIVRLDNALRKTFEQVEINPDKIGVLGYSNGARYALMVGMANRSFFSTIAAIAPARIGIPASHEGGEKIFISHGRRDAVLPFEATACKMVPLLTQLGNDVYFWAHGGPHRMDKESISRAINHFANDGKVIGVEPSTTNCKD